MHSFHSGTRPSHYYGTTILKGGKILYKNGSLTNALNNGYIFIADELNLSSISNIKAISPALEINLKYNNLNEMNAERLGKYMINLNKKNFEEISQWSLRDITKILQREFIHSELHDILKISNLYMKFYFIL